MITVAGKVRDVMGTDKEIAIDDEQIITLIKIAEKYVREDAFEYKEDVTPNNNPSSGASWDGSNTAFTVSESIMDKDFDESTNDDVEGYWWDSNNSPHTATVVVTNARYGRVTITQDDDSTPIPASATQVYVSYYTSERNIPFADLEELGTLISAHLVMLRMTEPRKISYADLENNRRILEIRTTEYSDEYKRLLNKINPVYMVAT